MVSKFDKRGKPSGITVTYLDSLEPCVKYWCYDNAGNEIVYYQGPPLETVTGMVLENDNNGIYPSVGDSIPRKYLRFSGVILNGLPFIGVLTWICFGYKFSDSGRLNSKAQVIGFAMTTSAYDGGYTC